MIKVLMLLTTLGAVMLAGCAPHEAEVAAARERIAQVKTLGEKALLSLEAGDLRQAAEQYSELHVLARATDIEAVEIPVDGESFQMAAERYRLTFRKEAANHLEQLAEAYLQSKVRLIDMDAFFHRILPEQYAKTRAEMIAKARKKAEQEMRLIFTGDIVSPTLRETVIDGIRAQTGEVGLHLGYGLKELPVGIGTIEVIIELRGTQINGTDNQPVGILPHAVHLDLVAHASHPTSWGGVKALTAQIDLPSESLAMTDAANFRQLRDEALAQLTRQVRQQLATLPPLVIEST